MQTLPDYYWLNEDSRKFLSRGYLKNGQSAEERILEIANAAAKILDDESFAQKFERYMAAGYISLSTPVWMNFGNERGLPISCFNSYVGDSIESFLTKQAEVGTMTKVGGGTSGYFGDIRPRGAPISTGGVAEGPVRAMELFDTVTNIVSQGSARRGSFAAYLPIDHDSFYEFMNIRSEGNTIQDMSIGVTVPPGWMQSMIDGDKEKRKRWATVIRKRSESGYPYIWFDDNANENKPQVYKDKNMRILSSNLCLTGDTKIIISDFDDGKDAVEVTLEDFVYMYEMGRFARGVYVKSYDGEKAAFKRVSAAACTAETDELYEIESPCGKIIRCTANHKILTKNRGYVEAQFLEESDELVVFE